MWPACGQLKHNLKEEEGEGEKVKSILPREKKDYRCNEIVFK